jgi:tagatose 1,6-diphosphate aldolase GatY/KbaY
VITPFAEILERERTAGRAVGAFTCYDLATACGVLRAAEEADVAVVLLVSNASFTSRDGSVLLKGLVAAAAQATAPACVQLDHVADLRTIEDAVQLGVGAVMADGSRLPLEENSAFVSAAVRIARSRGVGVEAELGHIEGGEDIAIATKAGALTEPEDAHGFVEGCQPDCLAVSIGNVHGDYAEPPQLDWVRLTAIRSRVKVPLSLHGASGLPRSDVLEAVRGGIAKVNVNAELRRHAFHELNEHLSDLNAGYRMLDLHGLLADAATAVARETLTSLRPPRTDL